MYTKPINRYPGKFEGNESRLIARVLYDLCGVSGYDEQCGDVQELGWYALFRGKKYGFIVYEDNNGFFDYTIYDSVREAEQDWRIIEETMERMDLATNVTW